MKKNTDRVSEAYYNELGKEFGDKVRERIHWVLASSKGETVLDVGCSQGLVSILLAREGKQVVGIDILEEAIDYAKEQLEKEETPTQKHLQLIHDNFVSHAFEQTFDVIIMGEILEHLSDPQRFINKAFQLLNPAGKLIITVPFGINDYFDHKHTYYIQDLFSYQTNELHLTELKFLNGWIGAIYHKDNTLSNKIIDDTIIQEFESALIDQERNHINQIVQLKKENEELKQQQDDKYLQEKMDKVKVQQELYKQYQAEEELLRKYSKLEEQYKSLRIQYNNLKSSKLGKLTTKYWKWRRKRSN